MGRFVGLYRRFVVVVNLEFEMLIFRLSTENCKIFLTKMFSKTSKKGLQVESKKIVSFTDYKRVMFMDGDMIPMTNLDYYFHLSDPECTDLPTELKSNFIMASKGEPCNTGMFMVTPSKEAFDDYIGILKISSQ
jgi:hypothetical protein